MPYHSVLPLRTDDNDFLRFMHYMASIFNLYGIFVSDGHIGVVDGDVWHIIQDFWLGGVTKAHLLLLRPGRLHGVFLKF